MKVGDIAKDAHEQMSEVVMGMMALFNTTDLDQVTMFTPVIMEIMELPRPQRIVGFTLLSEFFTEHAYDIEDPLHRKEVQHATPLLLWTVREARRKAEEIRQNNINAIMPPELT